MKILHLRIINMKAIILLVFIAVVVQAEFSTKEDALKQFNESKVLF